MQIFDIRFNPKTNEDRFFDFFSYEPENIYEKRLGSLYINGDLINSLPQNSRLIDNTTQVVRKKYYNFSFKSQEKALSESLKKANDFLGDEVKKDNVDWLGNFNFSILSLKEYNLTFSSSGKIKIVLMRGGEITNIGESLNNQEIEPYPLKVFFNIVSGKLIDGDKLLVASFDTYDFLEKKNIITKLSRAKELDKRGLKRFLSPSVLFDKKERSLSGLFTLFVIDNKPSQTEKIFVSETEERISIFAPFIKFPTYLTKIKRKIFRKAKNRQGANILESIKSYAGGLLFVFTNFKKILMNKSKIQKNKTRVSVKVKGENQSRLPFFTPNKLFLLIGPIIVVILVTAVFLFIPKKKPVEKPIVIATEEPKKEVVTNPSELESVDPKFIFSYDSGKIGFNPQNVIFSKSGFYLWAPNSRLVYNFDIESGNGSTMEADSEIISASPFSNSAIFFARPNYIYLPKGGKLAKEKITAPSSSSDLSLLSSYISNLYFFDTNKNEIIKYLEKSKYQWGASTTWSKTEITANPISLVTEDSLWLLSQENKITQYYKGEEKTSFNVTLDSKIELTHLKTGVDIPYLYLLDSINKRIIITNKEGKLIKQFASDKFSNIKSIEISKDGKTIWALCDNSVYEINFNF